MPQQQRTEEQLTGEQEADRATAAETDLGNDLRPHVRVAIIGTGFGGLGTAIQLRRRRMRDFVVFEQAPDLGGTWRDNTYPGCQCDVPSTLYSFSFAINPDWTRTFPLQQEIWDYLRRCAHRYGVMGHIRFSHEVVDARWDDAQRRWHIITSRGEWTADVLVAAFGGLSAPRLAELPGIDTFPGPLFHSAQWNHDVDLAGRRVAVIGTGASAVQLVPRIQPHVARLSVFQRTPGWVLPHSDRPTTAVERALYRRVPALQHAMRAAVYAGRELLVLGMAKDQRLLRPLERLARKHLAAQVPDPELRAKLTPGYSPGCKRLLLSNDYYPALTADNVELVTDRITEIRGSKIVSADGQARDIDVLIPATGFRVVDHPVAEVIRGRDGRSLAKEWSEHGMRAYLGTTVPGFPNLFLLSGPNTGIGHTSLVFMIEAQIRYVVEALRFLYRNRVAAVEVSPRAFEVFNDRLQSRMRRTVWTSGGCVSWYLDEHGRNPTLWPDHTWKFQRLARRFDPEAYLLTPLGGSDPASWR